jgi:hypothetical protein
VRSNSKFTQRARMAVLYESVAVDAAKENLSGDEFNRRVGEKFKELDAALQENWLTFGTKLASRLNTLAAEGKLDSPADWAIASSAVAATLREVR